jgi:hypothetical protein
VHAPSRYGDRRPAAPCLASALSCSMCHARLCQSRQRCLQRQTRSAPSNVRPIPKDVRYWVRARPREQRAYAGYQRWYGACVPGASREWTAAPVMALARERNLEQACGGRMASSNMRVGVRGRWRLLVVGLASALIACGSSSDAGPGGGGAAGTGASGGASGAGATAGTAGSAGTAGTAGSGVSGGAGGSAGAAGASGVDASAGAGGEPDSGAFVEGSAGSASDGGSSDATGDARDGDHCPATAPVEHTPCTQFSGWCSYGGNYCCGETFRCAANGSWERLAVSCVCIDPVDAGQVPDAARDAAGASDARSCGQETTVEGCDARSDCHAVFEDARNCRCAQLGCCSRFVRCANGDKATCTGEASCDRLTPFCEGPYVVSYAGTCYEGCARATECGP